MKLKIKFDPKPLLNYVSIILATSLFITLTLIALPLTEKFSQNTPFNLTTKEDHYWSQEYILDLSTTEKKDAEITRDIIYRRLKRFGVEKVSVRNLGVQEDITQLQVVVNTTKNQELVKELISNRFDVQVMTRKDDVDFDDEENQFAYLFADNYNPTEWTRDDFRNIYITELKTNENSEAYFAIFKFWPNKESGFNAFLDKHRGEYIGVSIDGFVTPYLVPEVDQGIFAVPITTEDLEQIESIDILYNTGIIPINYTISEEIELEPQIIKLDYIRISIGFAISMLLTYAYLFLLRKDSVEILKTSLFSSILTASTYIVILKLLNIPIDVFLLPVIMTLTFVLTKVLTENKDSQLYLGSILILVLLTFNILATGYVVILATHLIYIILLSQISLTISRWYLDKVRKY